MGTKKARTIEEIELLEGCTNRDELGARYKKRFGTARTTEAAVAQHIRIDSLWRSRRVLLERLGMMRAERDKAAAQVEVRKLQIIHKGDQKKSSAFADDEIMVKIHNELAILVQLQREANEIHAKQLELFERRLEATVKDRVDKVIKERKIELTPAERTAVAGLVQMGGDYGAANVAKGHVSPG
jgi:hypothetical protein